MTSTTRLPRPDGAAVPGPRGVPQPAAPDLRPGADLREHWRRARRFARTLREDLDAAQRRDPAARSGVEVALAYPGLHAVWVHRTMVGSIGLVLAIPLTTAIAALVVTRAGAGASARHRDPSADGHAVHGGHGHAAALPAAGS